MIVSTYFVFFLKSKKNVFFFFVFINLVFIYLSLLISKAFIVIYI